MDATINILLADDDFDEHIFFKEAINKTNIIGHNVVSVYDGVQSLDLLLKRSTYRNSREPVTDLIILALNMPLMDGIGVIKEMNVNVTLRDIVVYERTSVANYKHMILCMS